jgi:tetratricopeptide (TPR) repeat protein
MAKLTKRQIKEDKFVTGLLKTQDYFNRYRSQILIAAIGVVLIAIVVVVLITNANKSAIVAENQYGDASMAIRGYFNTLEYDANQDGMPDGNLDSATVILNDARADFQQVYSKHGGSPMAKFAAFYLGSISFKLGNFQDAENYYNAFLKKYHINKNFEAAAKMGLAGCKESLRDFEAAGTMYLEIATKYPNFPQKIDALKKASINLARAGIQDKAVKAFNLLEDSDASRADVISTREFLYEQHILDPYTYNVD